MQVEAILRSMGGNGLYAGYESMAMCIRLVLEDSRRLLALQKQVYSVVAQNQGTTIACLKRRLDIFLDVLWKNGTSHQWRQLGLFSDQKPSVGEFIEAVVWYIQITAEEQAQEQLRRKFL